MVALGCVHVLSIQMCVLPVMRAWKPLIMHIDVHIHVELSEGSEGLPQCVFIASPLQVAQSSRER